MYNSGMMKKLYLVVPCYNESEVLPTTAKLFETELERLIKTKCISNQSRILLVDDGSSDDTWQIINNLSKKSKKFTGVKLSRNFGHESALLAGLMTAKDKADWVISLDADGQDDVTVIGKMVKHAQNGCDIVFGVRSSRQTDGWFKRVSARLFYKVMQALDTKTVYDHAGFRLMSRRALEELSRFSESNLFLRGIVSSMGFQTAVVTYNRARRLAGDTKYPLRKQFSLAVQAITSFSVRPLRLVSSLGTLILIVSLAIMIYAVIMKIVGQDISGWTFTTISIWLIGGLQMLSIGVVGEYIGKIYSETKRRPRYTIEKELK
jgi:glycosyltransferase involved in cell wall biosynthesis